MRGSCRDEVRLTIGDRTHTGVAFSGSGSVQKLAPLTVLRAL